MKLESKTLVHLSWAISLVASLLAIIAWGQLIDWNFGVVDTYYLFPLFGLLAFSVMWSHYIADTLRIYTNHDKVVLQKFNRLTGYFVLVCILLHPGLLIWQLYLDGFGLPPFSVLKYVSGPLAIFIWFGIIAWLIFMAFEFKRKYGQKKWWHWVDRANDLAMVLIFFHGLQLGSHMSGWFQNLWYFYGITLAFCLGYYYLNTRKS